MAKNYFFKTLIIGGFLLTAIVSKAQHDPYYTHFRFNKQAYNPAAAGVKEDFICINGLSHLQWRRYDDQTFVTGTDVDPKAEVIKNVAPETHNLNLNTLFKIGKTNQKIGVGLTLLDDKVGFMKTTTVKGAINYRRPIQGPFAFISFGVEVGSTSFGYSTPKFKYIDPNDPKIPVSGGSESNLDVGVGVYYQQAKFLNVLQDFYVGASYNHLNAAKYDFSVTMANNTQGAVDMNFVRYLYLTSGADWHLANPNWVLEPAVLVKYNPKFQLDLNMTSLFANTFRMGLGYRTAADAISVLLGYQRGQLQVGYSYDVTLSRVRKVSDGTHEIFVKYCIPISFPPPPPRGFKLSPRFLGRGAY